MECWKCGEKLEEYTDQFGVQGSVCKVPFRATCSHCQAALHSCSGCKHYKPGLPNDCEVPGTDYVSDREAVNFCEDFLILGKKISKRATSQDVEKRLFGDEPKEKKKNRFDDFFK